MMMCSCNSGRKPRTVMTKDGQLFGQLCEDCLPARTKGVADNLDLTAWERDILARTAALAACLVPAPESVL